MRRWLKVPRRSLNNYRLTWWSAHHPPCSSTQVHLFIAAAKSCARRRDLDNAKALHELACMAGFHGSSYVETAVIDMYAKSGDLLQARNVFESVNSSDVVPWNALMHGYVTNGESEQALELYTRMTSEAACQPDARTLVAAAMACSSLAEKEQGSSVDGGVVKLATLHKGFQVHCRAVRSGAHSDIYVSNTVIDMYGKCGSVVDARLVFDRMEFHDVVSWTALILGYAENGDSRLALDLLQCMLLTPCAPNARTFVAALVACANLAVEEQGEKVGGKVLKLESLEKGVRLHQRARELGYERDVFVASTLVDVYAKCGSLDDARTVFISMPSRDTVSWNALILGCVVNGETESALECFKSMKREGCVPDTRTFVAALMACSTLASKEEGRLVEGRMIKPRSLKEGVSIHREAADDDVYVSTGLVDMYSKCGCLTEAFGIFRNMSRRTAAAWNSLIHGCVTSGQSESALDMFWAMVKDGDDCFPDPPSFVAALAACSDLAEKEAGVEHGQGKKLLKTESLDKGMQVHALAVKQGFETELFVGSTLVDMYSQCGNLGKARMVFDSMWNPDVVSWNALLLGYADNGDGQIALDMFHHGHEPNERSFVAALLACSSLGMHEKDVHLQKTVKLEHLREIHSEATDMGFDSNIFVANTLVDLYAKSGSMSEARQVFDSIPAPSIVSWNAMLLGYVVNGENELALEFLSDMKTRYGSLDIRTYVAALMACGNLVAVKEGKELHSEVCRYGLESHMFITSTLVDFYGKSGSMCSAHHVFNSVSAQDLDLVPWNALLAGYGRQGDTEQVLEVFRMMREENVKLVGATFSVVLSACSHVGMVNKGRELFDVMCAVYGIKPEIEHYQCMIDLLGRANQLDEALAMAGSMPFKPSVVTWTTILSACEKWRNLEVGKVAFDSLMALDDKHGPAYTLMANILSSNIIHTV